MLSVDPNGQKWQRSSQSLHLPSTSKIPACVVLEEGKFGNEQFLGFFVFPEKSKQLLRVGPAFRGSLGVSVQASGLKEYI